MGILAAYMVPHPPMIVPGVGRGQERCIPETIRAYEQVAEEIAGLEPETIIISSPHSVMYADYFHLSPGKGARGSFARFGDPRTAFSESYDAELVKKIAELAGQRNVPAGVQGERSPELDHGVLVPLYFIRKHYSHGRIVRIGLSGLPLREHYRLGMIIRNAVQALNRKVVFVASGDLSHKLREEGPYGFAPEGPEYDRKIMESCGSGRFDELFGFGETFCRRAAECGHRTFVMMAGALDGVRVEAHALSHEDVTGVGYGICTFHPGAADRDRCFLDAEMEREERERKWIREREDAFVRLARETVERKVRGDRRNIPVAEELRGARAGVFVSLHKNGQLRGCIGTISPVQSDIGEEIMANAISAATRDPRFEPVREDELDQLTYKVDVLMPPERISGPEQLDVRRYGVIVTNGMRRGLLLPDLEGVDTVEEQIRIAREKAGISPREPISLERFEVIRHDPATSREEGPDHGTV
ncbi:MAG: AmmeMemoRadiSam system protein A [Clostridia bacterium]|nr:AmmeMemoRadiSam system protein A [Clostridia bacterium]